MAEYVTLLGAEQVQNAASTMRHAAEDMQRAASSYYETVMQQQRFMNDWLDRFEQIVSKADSRGANG